MNKIKTGRILISRTDAIGDVVLTLPLTGLLKKYIPGCRIIFFGRTYTQPVAEACEHVDEFINYDDFEKQNPSGKIFFLKDLHIDAIVHVYPRSNIASAAKVAGIRTRIGTTNRLYHWWTCNRLISLSRKNSDFHEAHLNTKLLKPFGIPSAFHLNELADYTGLVKTKPLPERLRKYLSPGKFNLVLHPKSNVSAREWSLDRYRELIGILPPEKYNIIITGSEKEKSFLDAWVNLLPAHVLNVSGLMNLEELISFISESDGLVAASTGPLHLAASLGKHALGIYPPIRPMHPGRWAPIGKLAEFIVVNKTCSDCRKNPPGCHCMNEVTANEAAERILRWTGN